MEDEVFDSGGKYKNGEHTKPIDAFGDPGYR